MQGSIVDREAKEKLEAIGGGDLDLKGKDLAQVIYQVCLEDVCDEIVRDSRDSLPYVAAVEADRTKGSHAFTEDFFSISNLERGKDEKSSSTKNGHLLFFSVIILFY